MSRTSTRPCARPKVLRVALALGLALALCGVARADAVQALRDFVAQAQSGRAEFTQTVTSPDGSRRRQSSGSFEFQRPNRFRFSYLKPHEQLIVCDGVRVWLYDPGLKQATARRIGQALSATPAALLAGTDVERDFTLSAQAGADGLQWVQAVPRVQDGTVQSVRVGFRGRELAALEISDAFGQRSLLQFSQLQLNVAIAPSQFRFSPPAGADVIEQ